MKVRKLDPGSFVHAYNVDLQLLYPWEGTVEPPFGAAWAVLAPGQSTKPHAHQELETFFIARGRGTMAIGEERVAIEAGDVTLHEPFDSHVLTNDSDEELLFLTVWWEDRGTWQGHATAAAAGAPWPGVERVLVTAAPPTPNGDLHLGHLAGPYLSADAYARALRLRGIDARFACGTDDNSIYVQAIGDALGIGAEAAADQFATRISETLDLAGVELAAFPRPNASPHHRDQTRRFFRALHDRGELVERVSEQPWCETCDRYLFESGIAGRCPHCGTGVVGNTCEDCGRVNDAADLADASCTACGRPPARRAVRRLVFPLARHADRLRDYYREASMSSHLRALCERVLEDGLPEVAVTHPASWGIEVPVAGWEDQRIYVWLEMAARYLAYAASIEDRATGSDGGGEGGGGEGGWRRWWRSPEAAAVQFFGYDNGFYYGMLIPALLSAYDPDIRLPRAFVTNEFYRLDGSKFSTSRDHRILGRELLAPAAGPAAPRDAVRYVLAATAPERVQTNFTLAELDRTSAEELLGEWQAWLAELGSRLTEVPATGDWTGEHRAFHRRLEELLAEAAASYSAERFSLQRAARTMAEIVREARRFAAGESHWEGVASRGEERRTALALEALAAKLLGLIAAPVMPDLAARLWRQLGYDAGPAAGAWLDALDWVPAGQRTAGLGDPLLPGLERWLEERHGSAGALRETPALAAG